MSPTNSVRSAGLPAYPSSGDPLTRNGPRVPASAPAPVHTGAPSTPSLGLAGAPQRLGAAGRRARRQGVLLAGLLILAGAAGALYLSTSGDAGTDIVVLARPVPRGQVVTAADLATIQVTARGGRVRLATPAVAAASVVGKAALIDLGAGTPISAQMVASSTPDLGQVSVGIRVASDGLPDALLRAGQAVAVVRTDASSGDGEIIVEKADVLSVTRPSATSAGDGDIVVYLSVPAEQASSVAGAASTRGGVRLLGVRS